jgi:AAA15 family ATPase/GTPase
MYIRQLSVANYRSLKNVSIGSLSPLVVLYGNNDTGKSNVLSLLELIFRQKYFEDITEVPGGEELPPKRLGGFWRGEIDNFSDNFYQCRNDPITFSINIRFHRQEIRTIRSLPKEFLNGLSANDRFDHLLIEGQIEPIGADRARMSLLNAQFDQKKFYDDNLPDASKFLPEFKLNSTQARDVFDKIMGMLDGAFLRVPTGRFLSAEKEFPRSQEADLAPGSFKNWLFQASIHRNREQLFRQVSEQFSASPFEYGRISFARAGTEEIEAFVEDQYGLKLPIGRKGTGVQQILIILSYVAQSRSPLIGVEELEINLSPRAQTSIFDSLFRLVNTAESPIKQIFLTTHSPHIARRDEAQRRAVFMENGETKIKRPSEAEIEGFFRFPY